MSNESINLNHNVFVWRLGQNPIGIPGAKERLWSLKHASCQTLKKRHAAIPLPDIYATANSSDTQSHQAAAIFLVFFTTVENTLLR